MKKRSLLFSLVLLLVLLVGATNSFAYRFEDVIKKGNELYKNGQFEKAIAEYKSILDQGYESAGIYYNLGNCYYKLGKLGYAILYYEKALKLNPDDEDINYNLKIARAHTVDKIKEVPQIFLVEWWDGLLAALTLKGWAMFASILFVLFVLAVGFYYLSNNLDLRRFSFIAGSFLITLFVINVFVLIAKYDRETKTQYGVVVTNVVTVKQSPDEKSSDAFIVHEGLKFKIEDSLDNWVKVRLSDGKVGWMPKGVFEII